MRNIVLIGGGSGTISLIKGIKDLKDINFYVVVTVADSGGSTGRIRDEYHIPAVGDIRQVLTSLAKNNNPLYELMQYRFKNPDNPKYESISRHCLGNLIIAAIIDIKKDFYDGIKYLSKIFNLDGEIVPITNEGHIQLKAIYEDGSVQIKEHLIPNENKKISEITYEKLDFKVNPRVIETINNADYIILGCGSLYTSLIANICIPEVKKAIINNKKAKKIYFCNLVTQNGETNNMTAYDHIKAIEKHLEYGAIDIVIVNSKINKDSKLIDKYLQSKQNFIFADEKLKNSHCEVIETSLINNDDLDYIRHDVKKIKKVIKQILEKE